MPALKWATNPGLRPEGNLRLTGMSFSSRGDSFVLQMSKKALKAPANGRSHFGCKLAVSCCDKDPNWFKILTR